MDDKKLARARQSVGCACFVNNFEQFNSNLPTQDIVEYLVNNYGYKEAASRTRVNNAQKIISSGSAADIFHYIIESKRIEQSIRVRAELLLKSVELAKETN